ncbi:MAG TPA: thioesterase family protein, partial [Puia sp.]|nr:thioesterase family protein [Puia sp.]
DLNMFVSETHIRVRYAETDQMKVVYHGNYAQYFETARAESIRNLGYTYKDMEDMGVIMPIVELHVKFIRPAEYDDLLTVKTMLQELPEGHRIEFRHEVYNQQGKLLTWGKVVLYFLDAKTMEKVAMPEPLRKKLETHFHTAGKKGQKI